MYEGIEDSISVTLFAVVDDGGSGPTQMYAEFQPSADENYSIPEGFTLYIQRVGIALDYPTTGESGWGSLRAMAYDENMETILLSDVLSGPYAPDVVSAQHWCFFDVSAEVESGHVLKLALDNPSEVRGRARFVIRGWLVPDEAE